MTIASLVAGGPLHMGAESRHSGAGLKLPDSPEDHEQGNATGGRKPVRHMSHLPVVESGARYHSGVARSNGFPNCFDWPGNEDV